MQFLANLVAEPLTIFVIVAALIIWAACSAFQLHRQTAQFIELLGRARSVVDSEDNARGFARSFEITAEKIAAALGRMFPTWSAYRETLVIPDGEFPRVIRSTLRPDSMFDLSLLRSVGLRPRYHAGMPGMLVGAGLLFTFLGLAAGLTAAGGVVAGIDATQSRKWLHQLLDTASFKFITSLVGLALSISYTGFRNGRMRLVEGALDAFNTALERQMPLATPAFLQHEANEILRRQSASLDTFGNELAISIGQSLDAAFDQRLGEHIGPLREAIEALAARTNSQNEDAVRQMLEAFTERLSGGTRDHLANVAGKLEALGARLEGLQDGLGDASVRLAQAADNMARRMGDGAEAALSRITDQMGGLMETLRSVAAQTRDAGAEAEAAQALGARIEAAAAGLETAATQMSGRFAAAAADTGEALTQAAAGSRAALAEGAEEAAKRLQGAADSVHELLETTGQGLARQATALGGAAEALEARVTALDRATRDALAPLAAGAADLRQAAAQAQGATAPLRAVAESLDTTIERIGGAAQTFSAAQASAAGLSAEMAKAAQRFEGVDRSLDETLRALGAGLDQFTREIQGFVTKTNSDLAKAAQQISTLIKELEETIEEFGLPRRPTPPSPPPRPRV